MTVAELEIRVAALEERIAQLQLELERSRFAERIRLGLDEVTQGKVRPAREVLEELRVKHGIPLK